MATSVTAQPSTTPQTISAKVTGSSAIEVFTGISLGCKFCLMERFSCKNVCERMV